MKAKSQFDICNPCVPQSRKRPVCYEEGYASAEFHTEAVTNAVSERNFSRLRRIKTYLCTNMKQSRLNRLMTLHVHKETTEKLDSISVANDFVSLNDKRDYHLGSLIFMLKD